MQEVTINSNVVDAKELNHINNQLVNWDLNSVEGRALYSGSMNRGFAYLKIKMYESLNSRSSKVIWNVPEIELPLDFRPIIIDGLMFFLGYLEGIKGQSISLNFEINDGSYHPVDSDLFGYNRVTTRAIIDCFAPDYFDFKANRVFRQTSFKGHDTGL